MPDQHSLDGTFSHNTFTASAELPRTEWKQEKTFAMKDAFEKPQETPKPGKTVLRLVVFFCTIVALAFVMNAIITSGLRRLKTSAFGASNRIMEGKVNAQVVITGSSRALSHYDPRTIETIAGRTAYNLGRNGSQTDMQVAFLKAYLAHNRKPDVVIHNLDAFTFVTTREVYDPVEYTPYLYDHELYSALRKINPNIWKSRYLPLYGYVVEDINFSWIQGVKGFTGWSPREDFFQGFNPRSKEWTGEFESLKAGNPNGVSFEIEPAGIQDVEELIRVCKQNGIQLIFVYSPEYIEMQSLTKNRAKIFSQFHELAARSDVPLWDYSDWKYAGDKQFFQNSQHLNADGAAVFSKDLSERLKQYLAAQPGVENAQAPTSANHSDTGKN